MPHLLFLGNWVLVAPYLCFRFLFFIDSFWKSIFLKLRGGGQTYFNHVYV
jgi:hypothetical protein